MKEFTLREIEQCINGKLIKGNLNDKIAGVAIDSRKVTKNQLFFAIIGDNNNGHKYVKQVYEKGIRNVVISEPLAIEGLDEINAILVDDTKDALINLGKYYLDQINPKKVVVTGSVGKTSTRDMTYYILKEKYKTGRNTGNLNTCYGICMTIMDFESDLEAVVFEAGMDRFGEIDEDVKFIRPNVGVITNVGVSHIENLGSREGILKAKMEVTNYFNEENLLIVNQSCDLLSVENTKGSYRLNTVGISPENDAQVSDVKDYGDEGFEYKLKIGGREYNIRLSIPGAHNAINSALAIMAGLELGIDVETAIKGLQKMELTGKRLTVKEKNNIKVIDDTYNACPDSMKSALRSLMATKGNRKIAILGDMYELGSESALFHKDLGAFAASLENLDALITVGKLGKDIYQGAKEASESMNIAHFDTKEQLYPKLHELIKENDVVLVKASRGLETETIVEEILK